MKTLILAAIRCSLMFTRHSVALFRPARRSLHRNVGASRVQRRGERKRSQELDRTDFV